MDSYDEYLDQLERENQEFIDRMVDASIETIAEWTGEDEEDVRERYEEFLRRDDDE